MGRYSLSFIYFVLFFIKYERKYKIFKKNTLEKHKNSNENKKHLRKRKGWQSSDYKVFCKDCWRQLTELIKNKNEIKHWRIFHILCPLLKIDSEENKGYDDELLKRTSKILIKKVIKRVIGQIFLKLLEILSDLNGVFLNDWMYSSMSLIALFVSNSLSVSNSDKSGFIDSKNSALSWSSKIKFEKIFCGNWKI